MLYRVKVTKLQFDRFLYRAFNSHGSKDDGQREISMRVNRKLRAASIELPNDDPTTVPPRALIDLEQAFVFEEDEMGLVQERTKASIPFFTAWVDEEMDGVFAALKTAEKIDPTKLVEAREVVVAEPPASPAIAE